MKGFGIYVQNDLLEPKHCKTMKEGIWLYLWFLDKMTSITEDGYGIILGGKPITYKDIQHDLGIHQNTYLRYIKLLETGGYVTLKRTPVGFIVKIHKAKKVFNNKGSESQHSVTHQVEESESQQTPLTDVSESQKVPLRVTESATQSHRKRGSIYRQYKDNTNTHTVRARQLPAVKKTDEQMAGLAEKILDYYNREFGKAIKSTASFEKNLQFWLQSYSTADIHAAFLAAKADPYWRDKITPEKLFRQRNPNGETVDRIGDLMGRHYDD